MLLAKPGEGGRLSVSTNCCDVAQVPTQILLTWLPLLDELELDELELVELEEFDELLELELLELDELEVVEELAELDEPVFSPPQLDKILAATKNRLIA